MNCPGGGRGVVNPEGGNVQGRAGNNHAGGGPGGGRGTFNFGIWSISVESLHVHMLSSSLFLFLLNIAFGRAAGAGCCRIGLGFFAAMNNNGRLSGARRRLRLLAILP